MKNITITLILIFFGIFHISDINAITKTSASNANWGTASTWSPSGVPANGDDVIINHNVAVNTSTNQLGSLTINAGKTLTVNQSQTLTVIGNTIIYGTLTVSNGTASNNSWVKSKGNFTINAGGTFDLTGTNMRFDFFGTSNQTFTNNGTVTSPMADFTCENPAGVTLAVADPLLNPIVTTSVKLISGTVINSDLLTIGNLAANVTVQRGGTSGVPAGSFDQIPNYNFDYTTQTLTLIYDYSSTTMNAGFEIPGDGYVNNITMNRNSVTLVNDVYVVDNLTFSSTFNSTFDLGGRVLSLAGAFTRTGSTGILKGNGTSTIDCIGPGAQTLPTVTNGGLYDLYINNTNGVTLNGGITVNHTLQLSLGTLTNSATNNITMASGALIDRVDGSIAVTPAVVASGVYDLMYENSTVINTGPEMQNTAVIRDLTISNSNTVTLNADATVNRNIILSGGFFNIGAHTLTLKGDVQQGIFGIVFTGGTTSLLTLSGSGNVTLPDIVNDLNTLTINRAAGDIITLSGDLVISSTLNLTSGNINTGTFNLTLGTSGTSLGTLNYPNYPNVSSFTGVITGKFTRWFGTTSTQNLTVFPVGDVVAYSKPRIVTIQFGTTAGTRPTTAGTLTAQYFTGDPTYIGNPALFDNGGTYSINSLGKVGYWQMTATTLAGGTYSISINPHGFLGIFMCDRLRVLKRPSAGTSWTLQGAHVNGTSTPDTTANRSGLSGFSQFALAGNSVDNPLDGAMPVELTSFSYSVSTNDVKLSWITASEVNNSGFEIYRKSEQTDWSKIGFVIGSGTTNSPKTYNYTDKNLNTGKYSYKLKQIDYNGNYEYFIMSGIAEIGTPNKFGVSQNYPNPFNPSTTIGYSIPQNAFVTLKVYDIAGKEVAVLVNSQLNAGYYTVNLNADTYHLSNGAYFYKLTAGDKTEVKKLMLVK